MKNIVVACLIACLVVSCGPSESQIQQAIEQTEVAAAEATAQAPTITPAPTIAPTQTPAPSPTDPNDDARAFMAQAVKDTLLQLPEVGEVKGISFGDGAITIEFISTSSEKMEQPGKAFGVAAGLSYAMTSLTLPELETLAKGSPFVLRVIAISTDERYRYVTETDHPTMQTLAKIFDSPGGISSEEWQELAHGTFE